MAAGLPGLVRVYNFQHVAAVVCLGFFMREEFAAVHAQDPLRFRFLHGFIMRHFYVQINIKEKS